MIVKIGEEMFSAEAVRAIVTAQGGERPGCWIEMLAGDDIYVGGTRDEVAQEINRQIRRTGWPD